MINHQSHGVCSSSRPAGGTALAAGAQADAWRVSDGPQGLSQLRHSLEDILRTAGAAVGAIDAALLVTSELAGNALEHGTGPCQVQVLCDTDQSELLVEVADASTQRPVIGDTAPRGDDVPLAERGRGLLLVDHLARDWGVHCTDAGKTVWARLPLPSAGQAL
ncbi:hypothetical protein SSP24_72070 [Streptomyces spinoverrucosus]|uniref:Histidine kinase/HSP90-like ATPase domain-containing protein n=1 Tax=Streptomyces spinoverrucosus TaxID=284043 RepID=A0A4Y3VRA4_9ACTN|nr:ATP-binding protein [Streptomyces spinoverrucosus]GEC09552.1 hypothetical protein SSP24_72070 [Streptomyces spinoverrucosus]GHB95905.1 hypothetical protein GCM10010397_80670 [Streptomyces spinoverrucosus]